MLLKRLEQWDYHSFCSLFSRSSSRQAFVASYFLSKTADGPLYLLLCGILYLFNHSYAIELTTILLLAFTLELPLYLLLKNCIKRERPVDILSVFGYAHITPSDRFSLPSGHTAGAFVVATTLAIYFPALAVLALIWACSVGLSRIMLGVHFPLDVIAGAMLGVVCSLSAYTLYN